MITIDQEPTKGGYVGIVREPACQLNHKTDVFSTPKMALNAARVWARWYVSLSVGGVDTVYYILSIPETWAGPPIGADIYSGLHIKIGYTNNVQRRFDNLRTGTSNQLIIHALEPGGSALEKELHLRFASDRRQGEWFACSSVLRMHVISVFTKNHSLPPKHQTLLSEFIERITILEKIRQVFDGPPDMINPSINDPWSGNILIDLRFANPLKQ